MEVHQCLWMEDDRPDQATQVRAVGVRLEHYESPLPNRLPQNEFLVINVGVSGSIA